jgi:hypothetical protein
LFDKRFAVYEAIRQLLFLYGSNDEVDPNRANELFAKAKESRWLLSNDIYLYVVYELYPNVGKLQAARTAVKNMREDGDLRVATKLRQDNIKALKDAMDWVNVEAKKLDDRFVGLLQLEH